MLIGDSIDSLGITRNTLQPNNTSNFRSTLLLGWNDIHRTDRSTGINREDNSASLVAVLTSTDISASTLDIDAAYVFSDDEETGDLLGVGVSAVQRLGKLSTSFRLLSSFAVNDETAVSTDGTLLFGELSWTPHGSYNHAYVTAFWAIDDYSSVARDPAAGGPLGPAGINFAAVGLGSYGAPLSSAAREVAGGAFGYQMFFANTRKQLIVELGARIGTANDVENQAAATARYQTALGRHFVVVADGFVAYREDLRGGGNDNTLYGGRLELVTKF
jgi:hypothetical protein